MGRSLSTRPARVVSLVPSLTEAVAMLACSHLLVGRTDFCVSPREVLTLPSVGGTKTFTVEKVLALRPDLILAAKEETPKKLAQALMGSTPVWVADPHGPEDIPRLWRELGDLLGAAAQGEKLALQVENELLSKPDFAEESFMAGFVYFVWYKPWMAAGPTTYVSRLFSHSGFVNVIPSGSHRYPVVSPQDVLSSAVRVHVYPDEPYDFPLPDVLSHWGKSWQKLFGPPRAIREASQSEEGEKVGELSLQAFLWDGRILCLKLSGADLTWYPSRTHRGLRLTRQLANLVYRFLEIQA